MQERVLGGIIIGGIAICGVVWAIVQGTISTGNAKKSEAALETKIVEIVSQYDSSITSMDGSVVSYYTDEDTIKVPVRYNEDGTVSRWKNQKIVVPYVTIYGTNQNNEEIKVTFKSVSNYVLDLDSRKVDSIKKEDIKDFLTTETGSAKAKKEIHTNYSLTTPNLILDIINNPESFLAEMTVNNKEKYRVDVDSEGKIKDVYIDGIKQ